ncbi:hypothetical protein [Rhizohabitans arisaemae]|uniref:hypothetical protein n=1 Tax=Rhizohabitans arisaemae TaxID=2720610 RepID=UPI0024B259F6|nr:hypothetical protein [Rhizohabitans arisaemae]
MSRLDPVRGSAEPVEHNARTIAALAVNPGCDRRAVLDAAGVDKRKTARHLGRSGAFGRSPFAQSRENSFADLVKADGAAHLLRLLRERFGLSLSEVAYVDVSDAGADRRAEVRHARTRTELARAAEGRETTGTLFDNPMLKLDVAGYEVYLEPRVIAFQVRGRFHVVEIKSFPIVDDQADAAQVSAAARQSAVYVHAMRCVFADLGLDPGRVSHEVLLVCPKDFANHPTAALIDVRPQLSVLRRQLARLKRIDHILDGLPAGFTLDLRPDAAGTPTRPAAELRTALTTVEARYAPECLDSCEMAFFCRDEARAADRVEALGRSVREELGGLESVAAVLALADGTASPTDDQQEIAARLRHVQLLYAEAVA